MINLQIIYGFIFLVLLLNIVSFIRRIRNFKRIELVFYTYLLISILGWIFSNAIADTLRDFEYARLAAQAAILFPLNFMTALLNISLVFPKRVSAVSNTEKNIFVGINYISIILTIYFTLNLSNTSNVSSFSIVSDGPSQYTPGNLYYFSLLYAIILFVFMAWNWISKLQNYTQTQRSQIKIILISLGFVYLSLGLGLTFFPLVGLIKYGPTAFISLGLLLYILNQTFFSRAFLADINLDLSILVSAILSSIILTLGVKFIIGNSSQFDSLSIGLLSLITLSVLYYMSNKILSFPQRSIEGLRRKILAFSDRNSSLHRKEDIINDALNTLQSIFPKSTIDISLRISPKNPLLNDAFKWWLYAKDIKTLTTELIIEQTPDSLKEKGWVKRLIREMISNSTNIIIPIKSEKGILGAITITGGQTPIKEREYELLQLFMQNFSVGITRSYLYSRVKDLNENLERKVDEQTKELTNRFQQLVKAQQREKDMIDIMGHELRTPISIIKFQFGLLNQRIKNTSLARIINPYLDSISSAVQREGRLINSLLGATKLDQNKMELHIEQLNLIDLIKESISAQKNDVEKKRLNLKFEFADSKDWEIEADKTRILEVFDNFINNSVKYTQEGEISITIEKIKNFFKIIIKDSGVGISKEGMRHLGEKFYRADTEKSTKKIVRPGGTGLGLYVSFGIIKRHGGKYKFESKLGHGTKITILLPQKQSKNTKIQKKSLNIFERIGLKSLSQSNK